MSKIQVIIFSFNRALQLDTLINSMLKHWKSPSFDLDVVYNTTTQDFQKGYEILIQRMKKYTNIRFHKESKDSPDSVNYFLLLNYFNYLQWRDFPVTRHPKTNFKSLTIDLMKRADAKLVMFLTDDAMFINDVEIEEEHIEWLRTNPKYAQYTLRVGVGMDDKEAHYTNHGHYLSWNFSNANCNTNWGYRFSVDAHIYDKNLIVKLFKRNIFVNPNTLEGPVCCDAIRQKWLDNGRGPVKPALLSFPINMVQTVVKNETLGVSLELLNNFYLQGYTMTYPIPNVLHHFQQYPKTLLLHKEGEKVESLFIAE